jgi:hypothetical protein
MKPRPVKRVFAEGALDGVPFVEMLAPVALMSPEIGPALAHKVAKAATLNGETFQSHCGLHPLIQIVVDHFHSNSGEGSFTKRTSSAKKCQVGARRSRPQRTI